MSKCKPENIRRLCQYIQDRRSGEMIQTPNYNRDYLGFDSISQVELDNLCDFAIDYILENSEYITNSMGEILFGWNSP